MKKITIALLLGFISVTSLLAQPCVPGSYTASGIYPDSITGIPPAYVNSLYSTVVTVVVPTDTVIDIGLGPMYFDIDSIGIINVAGMPTGFSFATNPANGFIPGNSSGCVLITGTPGIADVGAYPLTISVESWVNGIAMGFVDTITYYTLHVLDTLVTVSEINNNETASYNFPNPFSKETTITYFADNNKQVELVVYNSLGMVCHRALIESQKGENAVSLSFNQPNGVYFYTIRGEGLYIRNSMLVKH